MRETRPTHAAVWLIVVLSFVACSAAWLSPGANAASAPDEHNASEPIRLAGEIRGGSRFEKSLPGGLRFALVPLFEGEGTRSNGWQISVLGADTAQDFVRIATPPYHGPNDSAIEAWHFRGRSSSADSASVNAPQTEHGFYFVTSAKDYEAYRIALEKLLWPEGLSDAQVDSVQAVMDQIPRGEGLLNIHAMSLDGLGPGETPWFEKMRFDVVLTMPGAREKSEPILKPSDKPADKSGG